jgi:hypothetical protein
MTGLPLSHAQRRLRFLEQVGAGGVAYRLAEGIRLTGPRPGRLRPPGPPLRPPGRDAQPQPVPGPPPAVPGPARLREPGTRPGDRRLVAYVVPAAGRPVVAAEVRRAVAAVLPEGGRAAADGERQGRPRPAARARPRRRHDGRRPARRPGGGAVPVVRRGARCGAGRTRGRVLRTGRPLAARPTAGGAAPGREVAVRDVFGHPTVRGAGCLDGPATARPVLRRRAAT